MVFESLGAFMAWSGRIIIMVSGATAKIKTQILLRKHSKTTTFKVALLHLNKNKILSRRRNSIKNDILKMLLKSCWGSKNHRKFSWKTTKIQES
jgi:hypothetical protein